MSEYWQDSEDQPISREEMVCQGGVVIAVDKKKATVRVDRDKGCEGCSAKGSCGVMFADQTVLTVDNTLEAEVGQRVEIGVRSGAIVSASALLFIFPALSFIIGIIIGYAISGFFWPDVEQWSGFVSGIILFVLSYMLVRWLTPKINSKGQYEPQLTRILN